MLDQEKIIKGLECCKWSRQNVKPKKCNECPYKDQDLLNAFTVWRSCTNVLAGEALALLKDQNRLLKEQETTLKKDGHHISCTRCGEYWCDTDREGDAFPINFCPACGRKVKYK